MDEEFIAAFVDLLALCPWQGLWLFRNVLGMPYEFETLSAERCDFYVRQYFREVERRRGGRERAGA